MRIILKHEVERAKNGYLIRSPELHLASYGATLDLAIRNLERLATRYLSPFERAGSLQVEIEESGLLVEPSDTLTVSLTNAD